MELEEIIDTECFLCGGPLVEGNCIAYHWNDSIHRDNRKKIEAGLEPEAIEPVVIPEKGNWGPCWVCGARTDAEGRCTRVNDFVHDASYLSWMNLFHSQHEMESAPPASFLIEGFLQQEAITAVAAPVGQRKSLIALNVAHALVTGEKLFDYFAVTRRPSRVLYLCPEMGIQSFTDRLRKIGLMPYVGKTLFCRTMSAEGSLELSDLSAGVLTGAVVIIDTAVRYLKGDENSSEHMRAFSQTVFRLVRDGAASVLLLHHSAKGAKDSEKLSLENAMRGSGELGAFLNSCWATRLQNPDEPYQSASYLANVKMRDFESKPFEVTSGPDCRLHIVGDPGTRFVTLATKGNRPDKDGMGGAAERAIRERMDMPIRKLQEELVALGISRGTTWIAKTRARIKAESNAA